MSMKLILLSILLSLTIQLNAQKKLSFDLNAGILESVGKDISKIYHSETNPLFSLQYLSRRKFKHPYFNVLGHVNYSLSQRIGVGLQSGFYLHYLENYFSNVKRTALSIPVMATFTDNLVDINSHQAGIEVAGGTVFYNIDEFQFGIKNAVIYNASVFYTITKKSTIKLGVEKQIDHAWSYFPGDDWGSDYKNETYKYHLNRLALALSYSLKLGNNTLE